jgi:hypothetical protein
MALAVIISGIIAAVTVTWLKVSRKVLMLKGSHANHAGRSKPKTGAN